MTQKISKIVIALLAILIGLYPGIYFFKERKFGLLSSKSNELLANTLWNTAFYTHITLGGIALLIGWLQFNSKLRLRNLSMHRSIGKIYIVSVLISSLASIGLGFFATGGVISSTGFICLGIIWFSTTLLAYLKIKNMQVEQHRRLMIYSYAACFAAVTLRIWLPLLIILFGDFIVAYSIVAWLCWVPNLLVANLIVRKLRQYLI
ncbi:MAG: DUF2306 domain-containing protein [Ferruginibacter sp.]